MNFSQGCPQEHDNLSPSVAHIASLAQARSPSQLSGVLLRLHRYPAGVPLPGQGEVRHIHCLMGITFPREQLSGTGTAGRDSSDTYSEDGTVTRMAGTAVRHSQVSLADTRAEQSEPGTLPPQLHSDSACLLHSTHKNKSIKQDLLVQNTRTVQHPRPPALPSLCMAP